MKMSCFSSRLIDGDAQSLSPELDEARSSAEDRSSGFSSTFLSDEVIVVLAVSSRNLAGWGVKDQGQQNSGSCLLAFYIQPCNKF